MIVAKVEGLKRIPLLGKGGVTGWLVKRNCFGVRTNHPVRAFQRNGDISGWRVHPSLIITHKSSAGHERLGTTAGKGEVPSLAKEFTM